MADNPKPSGNNAPLLPRKPDFPPARKSYGHLVNPISHSHSHSHSHHQPLRLPYLLPPSLPQTILVPALAQYSRQMTAYVNIQQQNNNHNQHYSNFNRKNSRNMGNNPFRHTPYPQPPRPRMNYAPRQARPYSSNTYSPPPGYLGDPWANLINRLPQGLSFKSVLDLCSSFLASASVPVDVAGPLLIFDDDDGSYVHDHVSVNNNVITSSNVTHANSAVIVDSICFSPKLPNAVPEVNTHSNIFSTANAHFFNDKDRVDVEIDPLAVDKQLVPM